GFARFARLAPWSVFGAVERASPGAAVVVVRATCDPLLRSKPTMARLPTTMTPMATAMATRDPDSTGCAVANMSALGAECKGSDPLCGDTVLMGSDSNDIGARSRSTP